MTGTPAVFLRLVKELDTRDRKLDCPSLRRIVSGSDELDPEMAKRITSAFGIPIAEFYGQSEVSPMVAGSAQGHPPARLSVPFLPRGRLRSAMPTVRSRWVLGRARY